jgi:hypothetical protein
MIRVQVVALFYICHSSPWSVCRRWHSSTYVTHSHDPWAGGGTLPYLSLIPMIRVQAVALFYICHSSPWSVCRWWHSSTSVWSSWSWEPVSATRPGTMPTRWLDFYPLIQYSGKIILLFFHCIHGLRFTAIKNGVEFEGESWRTHSCIMLVLLNQSTCSNLFSSEAVKQKKKSSAYVVSTYTGGST